MSINAGTGMSEAPPSYDEAAYHDTDGEVLQPTILVLAGQSIHSESADTPPLYRLNRGIASLSHATQEVELERVEHSIRTNLDNEPSIKPYSRHIYNLRYLPDLLGTRPSDAPHYYIQALSKRRTVGNVGLRKSRFRSRWMAIPVDVSGKHSESGQPKFIKDAICLFKIHEKNQRFEWTDGDGNAIAVEDEGEYQHRLIVSASLCRKSMDALVALWCCRIWQHSAHLNDRIHLGMKVVRRKLRSANVVPEHDSYFRAASHPPHPVP